MPENIPNQGTTDPARIYLAEQNEAFALRNTLLVLVILFGLSRARARW